MKDNLIKFTMAFDPKNIDKVTILFDVLREASVDEGIIPIYISPSENMIALDWCPNTGIARFMSDPDDPLIINYVCDRRTRTRISITTNISSKLVKQCELYLKKDEDGNYINTFDVLALRIDEIDKEPLEEAYEEVKDELLFK